CGHVCTFRACSVLRRPSRPPGARISCLCSTQRRPPRSTPFPYTTLFRSVLHDEQRVRVRALEERFGRKRSRLPFVRECERPIGRSEEHTSELQSRENLVCRLLLEKKKTAINPPRKPNHRTEHLAGMKSKI